MLDALPATRLDPHNTPKHPGCYGIAAPRWCVAQTHPQAEHWADANLRRLGYRTYLPLYATQRRDRAIPSQRHIVLAPLFSRYLFIQHDNPDLWRPIREAPGVAAVLTCGSRIQYARAGAVEALQALDPVRRYIPAASTQWAPGSVCRVANGIMAGYPAAVLAIAHENALVSLMFLGQLREITLPIEFLQPQHED